MQGNQHKTDFITSKALKNKNITYFKNNINSTIKKYKLIKKDNPINIKTTKQEISYIVKRLNKIAEKTIMNFISYR